jgi:hypothetical protein
MITPTNASAAIGEALPQSATTAQSTSHTLIRKRVLTHPTASTRLRASTPTAQHTTASSLAPGDSIHFASIGANIPSSPSKETVPGPSPSPLRLAANATPTDLSVGPLLTDRLGKLVQQATEALESTSFEELCVHHRGPSCLTGGTLIPHPAADTLQELRDVGAPVLLSGTEWNHADLDAAVLRGAHQSTSHCRDFLREEFADMMEAGQWLVVPYYAIRHLLGLRLSPTGVVPQDNRRDRLIVDYSFSFVNQETERLAPDSLQFGFALYRILRFLQQADTRHGPIYLAKIDVADAFMRIAILAAHIPSLGTLLPSYPGKVPLVAFPLILPMGWIESPQYLCAVSETVADMANDLFQQGHVLDTPHRLDVLADSRPENFDLASKPLPFAVPPPLVRSQGPLQRPLNTAPFSNASTQCCGPFPRATTPSERSPTPPKSWPKEMLPGLQPNRFWDGILTQ